MADINKIMHTCFYNRRINIIIMSSLKGNKDKRQAFHENSFLFKYLTE